MLFLMIVRDCSLLPSSMCILGLDGYSKLFFCDFNSFLEYQDGGLFSASFS